MDEFNFRKMAQTYLDHQAKALLLGTTLGGDSIRQDTTLTIESLMQTIDELRYRFFKEPMIMAIWLISHTYEQQHNIELMFEKFTSQMVTVEIAGPPPEYSTLFGIRVKPWCLDARQTGEPLPPGYIWAKPGIYLEMSDGTFMLLEFKDGPTSNP